MNNSITNTTNSLNNHKQGHTRNNTRSPITVTLCDSDRQLYSTTVNYAESDSLILSKYSPKSSTNNNESILRINFKEKKNRPNSPLQSPKNRRSPLKRTYSYVDKNHCTQVRKPTQKKLYSLLIFFDI